MRGILVGLGDFGWEWYDVLEHDQDIDLVVVDKKVEKAEDLAPEITFYHSLSDAIERENCDFLINTTPPQIHDQINRTAFAVGLPVLSEAPIAAGYHQAQQIVNKAQEKSIPFQIAENYRQFSIIRAARKHINQGAIGQLKTIQVEFRKNLKADKSYFKQLDHPLLFDISIHHFDLIRYLSGAEAKRIFAQSFNPKESWLSGPANVYTFLELTANIAVNYSATLVAQESETSWLGTWKLEGTEGMIILRDHKLCLIKNGEVREITEFEAGLNLTSCLDNFIFSLTKEQQFGTDASDHLKTQQLVELARRSAEKDKLLTREDIS